MELQYWDCRSSDYTFVDDYKVKWFARPLFDLQKKEAENKRNRTGRRKQNLNLRIILSVPSISTQVTTFFFVKNASIINLLLWITIASLLTCFSPPAIHTNCLNTRSTIFTTDTKNIVREKNNIH